MKISRLRAAIPALLLVGILFPPTMEASEFQDTVDRWIEIRREIAEEESRWREDEDLLLRTRELLQSELQRLDESIAQLESETSSQQRERERLSAESEALDAVDDRISGRIATLEAALYTTYSRLPEPLRERTRPLGQRLAEGADATRPLSQRLQTVVGLLGEADRFQANLYAGREVIALPEGETREVRTLYLGLGQAYYLSPDGQRAGVGTPGANGWEWSSKPELAGEIRRAFAVYDNVVAPNFMRLPVTLQMR